MEKKRPVGRQKKVGSGTGKVARRGGGFSEKTEGPVGMRPGGYSKRPLRPAGGDSGGGYSPPAGEGSKPGGCLKYIGIIIFLIITVYLLYNNMGGEIGHLIDPESPEIIPNVSTLQEEMTSERPSLIHSSAYPVNRSVSELARDKRIFLRGEERDRATVMIYMCGTDLESQAGMATFDLQEILAADISENVNIIIETGGTARWKNNIINSRVNQRFRLLNEGIELLEEDLGRRSMVNPATLTDFIQYCNQNFPANRNLLILWDHGGGSLSGYGYDQYFPNDSMTLGEISQAIKDSGVIFDLIGFDACLMATLETAIALEPYADYLIASEEVEPGIGWSYTGWVTSLSNNPSLPTIDLGKKLIDDYIQDVRTKVPQSQGTLSLIDLAELKGTIPNALAEFASSTNKMIVEEADYKGVSNARAVTKEFARSSGTNQIDLIHFAQNLQTSESNLMIDSLKECIKYNRTTANIKNANGLSIFFPYGKVSSRINSMLETYREIDIGEEYRECIRSFASISAGGQAVSVGSGNILEILLDSFSGQTQSQPIPDNSPSGSGIISSLLNTFLSGNDQSNQLTGVAQNILSWLNTDLVESSVDFYENNHLNASLLKITEKNGQRVLSLPEEQWKLIHFMEMNVFVDDGEGFIDLGLDNVYEYNQDGDLIVEYDGTWLALNGNIVSYYLISDDHSDESYSIKGRIPAFLNDQLVDIIVVFDDKEPYGTVLGAQIKYDTDTETSTVAKGLLDILPGDKIDYICDYYTYDGRYSDSYYLGEQYFATGQWEIENLSIGMNNYQMTYRITDIYGNQFWTPSIQD